MSNLCADGPLGPHHIAAWCCALLHNKKKISIIQSRDTINTSAQQHKLYHLTVFIHNICQCIIIYGSGPILTISIRKVGVWSYWESVRLARLDSEYSEGLISSAMLDYKYTKGLVRVTRLGTKIIKGQQDQQDTWIVTIVIAMLPVLQCSTAVPDFDSLVK